MYNAEPFLEHYGKKGMRWGVRKRSSRSASDEGEQVFVRDAGKKIQTKGGSGLKGSEDAKRAAAAAQKVKKSGVKSLSNAELQSLVQRMNLESQHAKLSQQSKTKSAGRKFVEEFVVDSAKKQVGKELAKQVEKYVAKSIHTAGKGKG